MKSVVDKSSERSISLDHVVVIIPVYNDTIRLKLCLEALSKQDLPHIRLQVFVVDNNSTEDIGTVTSKFPFVRLLQEFNPGSYHARNQALKALGDHQFIGFTDADCIPAGDWVARAVSCLKASPQIAVGGPVRLFPESQLSPSLAEQFEMLFAFPQKHAIEKEHYSVTANLFITREMSEKAGFFNSDLYSGGDFGYGQQLRLAGFKLRYVDELVIHHPARATLKQLTSRIRRTAGGSYKQRKKYAELSSNYSWKAIIYGFRPPIRAFIKIFSEARGGIFSKLALCVLATYLRTYQAMIYAGYKIKLLRRMERF